MQRDDPASPFDPATRRRRAVDAIACVLIATVILAAFAGDSVRRAGEQMQPGLIADFVTAVGHPAGWIADQLPLAGAADDATAFLSPDDDLAGGEGFALSAQPAAAADAVAPVTADAFDPRDLGADPPARRPLRRLLVTGDSLAMPLDAELARRFGAAAGVSTEREPHIGTGISKTGLLDWGKLAVRQTTNEPPDAVVMFLGANEGFPMRPRGGGLPRECCDAAWAAEYAWRARLMMNTYRRDGDALVYWLTLPLPRDEQRREIAGIHVGRWCMVEGGHPDLLTCLALAPHVDLRGTVVAHEHGGEPRTHAGLPHECADVVTHPRAHRLGERATVDHSCARAHTSGH